LRLLLELFDLVSEPFVNEVKVFSYKSICLSELFNLETAAIQAVVGNSATHSLSYLKVAHLFVTRYGSDFFEELVPE